MEIKNEESLGQGFRDLAACAQVLNDNCKSLISSDEAVSPQTVLACLEGQIWRMSELASGLRALLSKKGSCEEEERSF